MLGLAFVLKDEKLSLSKPQSMGGSRLLEELHFHLCGTWDESL